jgi:alkenylglycerophosphocholine/alkenylglycerophosphoethanolamine hydrolase
MVNLYADLKEITRESRIVHRIILALFFSSAILYFPSKLHFGGEAWVNVLLKCMPICCLIVFVCTIWKFQRPHRYALSMIAGLLMSMVGDACLTQEGDLFFFGGLITFALAHIMYIRAFSLRPLKLKLAFKVYMFSFFTCAVFLTINNHWSQKFFGIKLWIISTLVLVYSFCLYGSFWRAVANISSLSDLGDWCTVTKSVGTVLFVISDNVLAVDQLLVSIPYAWIPVMILYYSAQLCLALSVIQPSRKSGSSNDDTGDKTCFNCEMYQSTAPRTPALLLVDDKPHKE